MASSAADGVQRYELAEATSTTSPRQFQFELYKRRTTVLLPRDLFLDLVCGARPRPLQVCCPQPARRSNARLQGSRLGITTVVSTDSIRHMMRSFVEEKENPLLWASTASSKRQKILFSGLQLIMRRTESVNLQFGTFGISAWPTDTGCTSQARNTDESWASANEGSSRHDPSSSGSPKKSDGHCKEIKESSAVSGSDEEDEEEADVRPDSGSDGDLSEEDNREIHEEMEGPIDEDCNRSDEEYDDLAMGDSMENGYLTDDGVFHAGLRKPSSIRFLDVNQRSHSTPRKHLEKLCSLSSKLDIGVPETARTSSAVPVSTSNKRHASKKWKRSLSDSFHSRPRSAPEFISTYKGSPPVPVAPEG